MIQEISVMRNQRFHWGLPQFKGQGWCGHMHGQIYSVWRLSLPRNGRVEGEKESLSCAITTVSRRVGAGTCQKEKQPCKFLAGVKEHPPTGINSEFTATQSLAHMYIKSWMRAMPSAARILKLYGFSILAERNKWNSKVNPLSAIERAWQGLKQNSWAMQALHTFFFLKTVLLSSLQDGQEHPLNKLQSPFAALRTLDHPGQNFS